MSDWTDLIPDELETLAIVERSLPPVSPPDEVLDRIMAAVQPEAVVVPLRPERRRRAPVVRALAAVGAVAAVVVLAVLVLRDDGAAPVDARAAIGGKSDPSVTGVALLHGAKADGGTLELTLRDVPPAPAGHHYEVWVLRNGGDNMESVGSFTPTSADVDLDLQLPGPGDYAAVDVSVEEDGGPPAHSDTSLASGTFS